MNEDTPIWEERKYPPEISLVKDGKLEIAQVTAGKKQLLQVADLA
jgi:hypothetical protein